MIFSIQKPWELEERKTMRTHLKVRPKALESGTVKPPSSTSSPWSPATFLSAAASATGQQKFELNISIRPIQQRSVCALNLQET